LIEEITWKTTLATFDCTFGTSLRTGRNGAEIVFYLDAAIYDTLG
jgi:hypothetical protein